jgi:hypothetical protein
MTQKVPATATGAFFLVERRLWTSDQATESKSLIMYFGLTLQFRKHSQASRNLMKLWREYGRVRVTIGKKA